MTRLGRTAPPRAGGATCQHVWRLATLASEPSVKRVVADHGEWGHDMVRETTRLMSKPTCTTARLATPSQRERWERWQG